MRGEEAAKVLKMQRRKQVDESRLKELEKVKGIEAQDSSDPFLDSYEQAFEAKLHKGDKEETKKDKAFMKQLKYSSHADIVNKYLAEKESMVKPNRGLRNQR